MDWIARGPFIANQFHLCSSGALHHEKDHEDGVDDIQVVLIFLASSVIVHLQEQNRTLSCRDSGD